MKKSIILMWSGLALLTLESHAAIVATSDDFSTNTNTFPSWTTVLGSPAIVHDAFSANDFDVNDLINSQGNALDGDGILGNLAGDTEVTGDGSLNDGGLLMNTQDATQGNEAIGLVIGGAMEPSELISLTMSFYNDNSSFYTGSVVLFNLTDGQTLATYSPTTINGAALASYAPIEFTLTYVTQSTDVGDTLQIRIIENANHISRDAYIDNFSISSTIIPEPTAGLLLLLGACGLFVVRRRFRRTTEQ